MSFPASILIATLVAIIVYVLQRLKRAWSQYHQIQQSYRTHYETFFTRITQALRKKAGHLPSSSNEIKKLTRQSVPALIQAQFQILDREMGSPRGIFRKKIAILKAHMAKNLQQDAFSFMKMLARQQNHPAQSYTPHMGAKNYTQYCLNLLHQSCKDMSVSIRVFNAIPHLFMLKTAAGKTLFYFLFKDEGYIERYDIPQWLIQYSSKNHQENYIVSNSIATRGAYALGKRAHLTFIPHSVIARIIKKLNRQSHQCHRERNGAQKKI